MAPATLQWVFLQQNRFFILRFLYLYIVVRDMLVIQQACPLIRKNQGMFKNLQDCMEEDILTCFPAIKKIKILSMVNGEHVCRLP